jgi:hypothetical protein
MDMKDRKPVTLKLDLQDIKNWNFEFPDDAITAKAYGSSVDIEIDFQAVTADMARQCIEALTTAVYARITPEGVVILGNKNCDSEADEKTYSVLIPWDDVMSEMDGADRFEAMQAALSAWIEHEKEILELS